MYSLLYRGNRIHGHLCFAQIVRTHSTTAKSLYSVLGIGQRASQKEVKDAFIRKSKLYHPDVNSTLEAKQKFQEVSEAYQVLGNTVTRKSYDRGVFLPFHNSDKSSSESPFHSQEAEAFRDGRRRGSRKMHSDFSQQADSFNFESFYKEHYSDNVSKSHIKRKGRESDAAGGQIDDVKRENAMLSVFTWFSVFGLTVLTIYFFIF